MLCFARRRSLFFVMKHPLALAVLITVSFALTSCFEVSSVLTVNKDGSGIIEETTLLSAQIKAMMATLPKASPDAGAGEGSMKMDILPTKAKAEEKAKKMGAGVALKSFEEVKAPDGREGVKVTYSLSDVSKVNYEPGDMKAKTEGAPMFGFNDGTLTINTPQDSAKKPEEPKSTTPKPSLDEMAQQMAMMKPMLAGMRMSFKVKAANGIASTDATHVEGDTITLMDMNFDKLLEKPDGMKKFAEMAEKKDMSSKDAAEAFKGLDGIKIEGKEKVTVKLK